MENQIKEICAKIQEKKDRLCEKTTRTINAIEFDTPNTEPAKSTNSTNSKISIGLFIGAAGLALLGLIAKDCCVESFTGAGAAAGAGIALSYNNRNHAKSEPKTNFDILSVKTDIKSKVLACVQQITSDWDVFANAKHREVKRIVEGINITEAERDKIESKLYFYETIQIPYKQIDSIIDGLSPDITNLAAIKTELSDIITRSINDTADKQLAVYKSII